MLSTAEEILRGLTLPQKRRLEQNLSHLAKDRNPNLTDMHQVGRILVEYSNGVYDVEAMFHHLESIGFSGSKYQSAQIKEQVQRFTLPDVDSFVWNRNHKAAVQDLIEEVKSWNLHALTFSTKEQIVDALPRLDTHAGWSYVLTGLRTKGEYTEELLSDYLDVERKAREEGSFNRPILVGCRTQSKGGYDTSGTEVEADWKSRLVSMIDIFLVLAERKFVAPFQQKFSQLDWYAGGKDDAIINSILCNRRNRFSFSVTVDYRKFDQSIPAFLIREAFDVVREAFHRDKFWDEELFKIVREDFINKVFVTPWGNVQSKKGIPSGSNFTQIIGSICNRIMVIAYLKSKGIEDYDMCIMGDDNIIFTKSEINIDDLSTYLNRNYGVSIHGSEKTSQVTTDKSPEFLSRTWTRRGVYRSPFELIPRLLFPERYRDYNKGADPYLIIYSYLDAFPLGMREIIDVGRFTLDNRRRLKDSSETSKYLSGLMQYRARYLRN